MAVLYNLTTSTDQASSISEALARNWNNIGAIAPELPDTISPFLGSLEVLLFCLYDFAIQLLTTSSSFRHILRQGTMTERWIC